MLYAINTLRNNKKYSALKVFSDLSLQQTDNNKWVVPQEEVLNYGEFEEGSEIQVSYIKQTEKNRNDTSYSVAPHFRIHPKFRSVELKKPNKNHNLIVDFIYNLLLTDEIKDINIVTSEYYNNKEKEEFYYNKLIDLDLNLKSIDYEVIVESEENKKRADIFINFNKVHEIYGKGLCFEIQLSKQKEEITKDRTYHRALLGLSTIWLYKQDITEKNELIIPRVMTISPYINVLNTTLQKTSKEIIKNYETQGILLDIKIDNFKDKLDEKFKQILTKTKMEDTICLKCGKGYIKKQKGKYGDFLSCTNYMECNKLKW